MTKAREAIARALNPMEWDDPSPNREDAVREDGYREADSVITALREAGLRIVPEEPDEAMIRAGAEEMDPTWGYPTNDVAFDWAKASYAKMISAYEDGK